jgi:hypothetical protein
VDAGRSLLDRFVLGGISGGQAAEILDRTRYAAAAVYPPEPPGAAGKVQLTAWGNYPKVRTQFAFTFDKNWKKRKSATGKSYWYSGRDGLSVALTAGQAFVSMGANSDPFAASPGTPSPEGFAEFHRGAALALWVEDPAIPLNRFLSEMKLPLQIPAEQLLVSLYPLPPDGPEQGAPPLTAPFAEPGSANYEAHLRIKTPTASQARALVTLFSMARLFASNAAGTGGITALLPIFFAYPPVQDGAFLNIRTAPMGAGEIALLFDLFSVYSTQN